ncbi:restriction endonuclease subunit S [Coprobacter fastidiosus]|jgi:type I restriction enzyme S subunit|uniref:restriction endonuclease subunit S n=1 Tax=Coprobacter fastidiosus TaxID=1099853 RepID=UPI00241DB0D5|nr:restriction endonuclease subunit S [Coprobacter fastidiosus]
MSKLQELIRELCPNGVVYKKLGDIAIIKNGRDYKHLGRGNIPVYGSGGIMSYVDAYVYEKPTVLIPRKGSLGNVFYVDTPFWNVDTIFYTIIDTSNVLPKFLYYVLLKEQLEKLNTAGGVPSLTQTVLNKILIPVPPPEVQEEIVKILDHFTDLAAELQVELQARKEQYEYYRNKLLTFAKIGAQSVTWMRMCDLFDMRNGYTPSKTNVEYWENGTVPWFRMEDIRQNGRILSDSIQHITSSAVKGGRLFPANSFIIATTATIGEHALIIADSLANQQFTNLQVRKSLIDKVNIKFLYYYMYIVGAWCKNNTNVSGFASVDMKKFKKLLIPIPSISKQQRIVAILDKFEVLVNDLSQGLPAEVAAVQEQYEYYRNKLLSFSRADMSA